jgi:hypothetical protein
MVEKLELAGTLGFGLFIGAFFGFVLSKGGVAEAGIGAVVLGVIGVIYAFTLGQTGGLEAV